VTARRVGYRVAYRLLQLVWLLARPAKSGVKCVLTDGDRVLLVRHTYGSRGWALPGGGLKRGEQPVAAARREMHEELGVDPPRWVDLGIVHATLDRRRDTIHVFGAELDGDPLTVDRGEIDTVEWFHRDQVPTLASLSAHILDAVLPAP
jgi:8-oxo-dGTP pyrophosphatase MutT (NUDIX family)